ADAIHVNYPEDEAVLEERLRLYPEGCLVARNGDVCRGYAIAHPWKRGAPPALNSLLGAIPADADIFYMHDVAIAPAQAKSGFGRAVVEIFKRQAVAKGFALIGLVSVNNSAAYWQRHGFRRVDSDALRRALQSYGGDAAYMECAL